MMEFHHPHPQPLPPRPDSSIFVRPPPRAPANPPTALPPSSSYSLPPHPPPLPAPSTAYAPFGYRDSRPVVYDYAQPNFSPRLPVSSAPAPVSIPPPPSHAQLSPLLMGSSSGYHFPHVNHGSQGQNQGQSQRGILGTNNRGLNTVYGEGKIRSSFLSILPVLF